MEHFLTKTLQFKTFDNNGTFFDKTTAMLRLLIIMEHFLTKPLQC